MHLHDPFSPDYFTARDRFRAAVAAAGGSPETHPIDAPGPQGEELTIDAALVGDTAAPAAVVVSSGLHGVEGFLGSAVQLALLDELAGGRVLPPGVRLLLLHGLNPFGFAWRRRWNEDNVDLNRNWLLEGEKFEGCPPHYRRLDRLVNPPSPPSRLEPFRLKAAWAVLRLGMRALKETLPVGQYEYPRGLFFGGHRPAQTQRIVAEHLPRWLAGAADVVHLDLHTGLGRWGTYKLLLDDPGDAPRARWFRQHFDRDAVAAAWSGTGGATYPSRGIWKRWCQARLADRKCHVTSVEFGTYPKLDVVAALRAENRAHFHCRPGDPRLERARCRLVEVFAPKSRRWREAVVRQGLRIVGQAVKTCSP